MSSPSAPSSRPSLGEAMPLTRYGVRHPDLPHVIELARADGEAVATHWPDAELVARSATRRRGITGTRTVWGPWTSVADRRPGLAAAAALRSARPAPSSGSLAPLLD
ncbi:hypothetical protein AB0C84_40340 [Actinomadura sp. NPDC048955]|uniref:hypothetical protein n=1 Tax=Actinomadura sp. NPDC048955 TaxID=3158228 RepID=UPI0033D9942C